MPTYLYREVFDDGSEGEPFEVEHPMTTSLDVHPLTGNKVKRVYSPPNLATRYTPGQTKTRLEDKNVEKAGFTKYVRDKVTGTYHKTAGKNKDAPDTLRP